jgi:Holliday junction resolvase RusA-like endonuclease
MDTWTLVYNQVPVSQNSKEWRQGWSQYQVRKDWKEQTFWLCKEQRIPPLERVRVEAVIFFRTAQRRDYDNYGTLFKPLMDGLVLAGVIPDDCHPYVERQRFADHQVDDARSRTEVTITALPRLVA